VSQVSDYTFDDLFGGPPAPDQRDGGGGHPSGKGPRRGSDGSPDRHAGRRRGRRWPLVLSLLLVIVATAAASTWLVVQRTTSSWGRQVTRIESPFTAIPSRPATDPTAGQALNVLVLGSDSRISAGDPQQWEAGAQRTDAIMIVHVTSDRKAAFVMSIPRDSWVNIPGHGTAKINAAFSWGGPPLMVQTVERLTGVRLDHFAIVDFDGFKQITDALGGVTITVPKTVTSAKQGTIKAGTSTMDGETALTYVRQRYNVPGGDFGRVKRQQNWIRAVLVKLKGINPVTDPAAFDRAVSALSAASEVDEGLTPQLIQDLAVDLQHMGPHDIRFFTVPVDGTGWSPDHKQSIVVLNTAVDAELWSAIRKDRIADWVTVRKPDSLGSIVH
jgi:LCP family protein required for cell wall assembly